MPYRFTPMGRLEILLVTTRQTGRWIVPKGWPVKGLTPAKSAAREAFEEAGLRGKIGTRPVGAFQYTKTADDPAGDMDCEVKIFPLLVKSQSAAWPEAGQRDLRWADPETAIALIGDEELKAVIAAFAKRVAASASKLTL